MVAKKRSEEQMPQANESTPVADRQERQTTESRADIKVGPTVAKKVRKEAEEIDPGEQIQSALGRTEQFIYKNGKILITILVVAVLIVSGILAYKHIYLANRSQQAADMMYVAEQQFGSAEYEFALEGDGNNAGFLQVMDKYGATHEGNIAKHYAGICYLKMGDQEKALEYLKAYKTTKGAPNEIVNAQNSGLQGDIYVQKGEYDKAVEMFKKAIEASANSFTTPVYLKKIALVYDKLGKHGDAVVALQRIKDQFPMSLEARDIDKYIGEQEQK